MSRDASVAAMWQGYSSQVYPTVEKDSNQYSELERTFYSGVLSLFSWLMTDLDAEDEPTEEDLNRMDRLDEELRQYFVSRIVKDRLG